MKKLYIRLSSLFILLVLGLKNTVVFSSEQEDAFGFTVHAVEPSTQIDPTKSYFYIQTVPEEEQTLEVKMRGTKKGDVKVQVFVENAITGNQGTLEYSNDENLMDESLKAPITSIVEPDVSDITVNNSEEKSVTFKVTPPSENYEGIKMGTLVFALTDEESGNISTEYSYKIGIMIACSGDEFTDGATLQLNEVRPSLNRGKKMVLANLQNPEPKLIEGLNITAQIENSNGTVIKEKKVQNYTMAPNSHFDFELDWGTQALPSGDFTLILRAENNFHTWNLRKEFSITANQANEINSESPFAIITPTWAKVTAIVLASLTLLLMLLLVIRRRTWSQQWKQLKIKRKKKKKRR